MNITILSADKVLNYKPKSNQRTSIIRITEPQTIFKPLVHQKKFCDLLELKFDDTHNYNKTRLLPSNIRLFNEQDTSDCLSFFERNRDVDTLVLHCHAGVSRSPAVAFGFAWFLKDEVMEQKILEDYPCVPNPLVLTLLAESLDMYNEKKSFIESYIDWTSEDIDIIF